MFSVHRRVTAMFWLLHANLRQLLVSMIGLVIAISLLASCFYYTGYATTDLYLGVFEELGYEQLEYTYQVSSGTGLTFQKIEEMIIQHDSDKVLAIAPFYPAFSLQANVSLPDNGEERMISGYHGIDISILDDCIPGSSLPSKPSEILAYVPETDNGTVKLNSQVTLSVSYLSGNNASVYSLTLIIAGIIKNSTMRDISLLKPLFQDNNYHFFTSLDQFTGLIQQIKQGLVSPDNPLVFLQEIVINVVMMKADPGTAKTTIYNVIAFMEDMHQYLGKKTIREKPYSDEIYGTVHYINSFLSTFVIYYIPALVLVTVLVLFSLSVINMKRHKTLALVKTRGISRHSIFFILLTETLVVAVIVTVISAVFGLPLALFIGKSNGFLTFALDVPRVEWMTTASTLQTIIILGFGFTFLVNLPAIVKLSRSKIVIHEQKANKTKKGRINLPKGQLDILLIVTGLLGMIILNFFTGIINNSDLELGQVFWDFVPLILMFLFLSPFLLLLGISLSLNKLILLIIQFSGYIFRKKDLWLLDAASRSLLRNVKVTTRTALLISINVSLLLFLAIVPLSYQERLIFTEYYNQGSDIYVPLYSSTDQQIQGVLDVFSSIEGLKSSSVVRKHIDTSSGGIHYSILGIQPGFHEIAYWMTGFAADSLESLEKALFAAHENNTVIIDSETAKRNDLTLGSNLSLQYTLRQETGIVQKSLEVKIAGVVEYFPSLILGSPDVTYFIGKYTFVEHIETERMHKEIRCRILPGYNPITVTQQVRDALERLGYDNSRLNSIPEILERSKTSRHSSYPWVIINSLFLSALIIILATIVLFNYTRLIQNKREIGLSRSLGMKYYQLFLLTLGDSLLLFFFSGIPGGLLGAITIFGTEILFFSQMYPFVGSYYKKNLNLNLPVYLSIYGVLFLMMAVAGVIISFKATRENVTEIMKAE